MIKKSDYQAMTELERYNIWKHTYAKKCCDCPVFINKNDDLEYVLFEGDEKEVKKISSVALSFYTVDEIRALIKPSENTEV
jgi:hypothetical protein